MSTSRKKRKLERPVRIKRGGMLGSLAFGLAFFLPGLLILVNMVQVKVLSCTRLEPSQISCVLESKLLAVVPLSSTPLPGLWGARVAQEWTESTSEDSQGRSQTRQYLAYWVALMTTKGEVALDSGKSDRIGSKERTVQNINAFIQNPASQSLHAYGDLSPLLYIWAPLLFMAPGLFIFIGAAKEIVAKFT